MALLPDDVGLGTHWGVSPVSVRSGRDLGGLGVSPAGSPQGPAARAGLPTLTLGMALSQIPGGIPQGSPMGDCPMATRCGHMSIPVTRSLVCHRPVSGLWVSLATGWFRGKLVQEQVMAGVQLDGNRAVVAWGRWSR